MTIHRKTMEKPPRPNSGEPDRYRLYGFQLLSSSGSPELGRRGFFALLMLFVVLVLGLPGHAQSPPMPVITGPPNVLVIVYQQPGGADQVDITYANTVPHAQASADIDALTQITGWPISSRSIKDAAAPLQNRSGAMTSVVFQVPGVVQDTTHTLPIEALARAFHSYKRLNAVFFVGPQFGFQGARSYADNDIKMVLDQHGTTYAYQVEILNPQFSRLPTASTPPIAPHRSPWGVLLGIFGVAALAGLIVYFLTARITPPSEPNSNERDTAADRLETTAKR